MTRYQSLIAKGLRGTPRGWLHTVFQVDTSLCDFIQDLRSGTHRDTAFYPGHILAAGCPWVPAGLETGASTGIVAPLTGGVGSPQRLGIQKAEERTTTKHLRVFVCPQCQLKA